jgi:hypothetical protein
MQKNNDNLTARRSMLLGFGAAVAGATLISAKPANAQITDFRPHRHNTDAWFDELPGDHRVFIDTSTATGGAEALVYASNLTNARQSAYANEPADFAMIICLRHFSTPFAFNDAMWAKYGSVFHSVMQMTDPDTNDAPQINLLRSSNYGLRLPNLGNTIDQIAELGVQFAICDAATQFFAGQIAGATGGDANDIYAEFKDNAIEGRFVSAGVMAMTRAQEYGYSLLYAG